MVSINVRTLDVHAARTSAKPHVEEIRKNQQNGGGTVSYHDPFSVSTARAVDSPRLQ
ncbi:hypothetical protein [uncultured Bifidobacterium sp.]|uniref:hypothetical protein n=1 Tax=uncultured Bifidobacterium sp. TaxID=165187 RepID=UPI0025961A28|nr:hypothetical protein [uncultured Bifidobacterium sp.]